MLGEALAAGRVEHQNARRTRLADIRIRAILRQRILRADVQLAFRQRQAFEGQVVTHAPAGGRNDMIGQGLRLRGQAIGNRIIPDQPASTLCSSKR